RDTQYSNVNYRNAHGKYLSEKSPFRQSLAGVVGTTSNESLLMDRSGNDELEELNENPEIFKRELAALRMMVKNDPNFSIPDNDQFLLRFLSARKFDSKKAFHMLQRYFLMKIKCPELFGCPLPSECGNMFELQAQNMLQERDQLGRRVYIIRVDNFDSSKVTIDDVFRTNVLALEQIVREAETQIAGIVVILDMAGLSLQHAKFFTPYYAKRMVELVQETFPLRFKGFPHSKRALLLRRGGSCTEAISKRRKLESGRKLRVEDLKNIILHGSDLSSLHAFITNDILPTEYRGNAGKFDNRSWYMQLLADENYFTQMQKYGYNIERTT
ncbi:hypothetical protein NQ317_017345, partial [Molorchus minor]